MIKKIPHTIGNQIFPLKCGFGIGYGIGRKYRPITVSVSVSDRNQNSGFGRSLYAGPTFAAGRTVWKKIIPSRQRINVCQDNYLVIISACRLNLALITYSISSVRTHFRTLARQPSKSQTKQLENRSSNRLLKRSLAFQKLQQSLENSFAKLKKSFISKSVKPTHSHQSEVHIECSGKGCCSQICSPVSFCHSAEILFFPLQKLRGALQTVVIAPYTYVRICCQGGIIVSQQSWQC